jgi:hypothetical protein
LVPKGFPGFRAKEGIHQSRKKRRPPMARLIGVLAIVVLVAAGVGYYLGWLKFSRGDRPGESSVTVTVDQEKIKHDLGQVKKATEKLGKGSGTSASDQTVQGKIERVDVPKRRVTLMTSDHKELTVQVTAETKIRMGEETGRLEDLQPGLPVISHYTARDGKYLCQTLTVETPHGS